MTIVKTKRAEVVGEKGNRTFTYNVFVDGKLLSDNVVMHEVKHVREYIFRGATYKTMSDVHVALGGSPTPPRRGKKAAPSATSAPEDTPKDTSQPVSAAAKDVPVEIPVSSPDNSAKSGEVTVGDLNIAYYKSGEGEYTILANGCRLPGKAYYVDNSYLYRSRRFTYMNELCGFLARDSTTIAIAKGANIHGLSWRPLGY